MAEWKYADRILFVDLTTGLIWDEQTPLALKKGFVGGAGFVAGLLMEVGSDGVVLAAGPLSDQMSGRLALGAAVPAQGRIALSSLGGRMAGALKDVGYDALVITGEMVSPGLLVLDEGKVRLLPAEHLWGRDLPDSEEILAREYGARFAAIMIGPAAEQRVAHATFAHEGHYAGGGGVAAALGAKRLKAVVVRDRIGLPGWCTGCTMNCQVRRLASTAQANLLGLDAHVAAAEAADADAAKRRRSPGPADLLGTCHRVFRERIGEVLRKALSTTLGLVS